MVRAPRKLLTPIMGDRSRLTTAKRSGKHMDPPFFYWLTAQYQFTEPHPGWFRDPEELGGEIRYGYLVDVLINARKPNGKYIGFQPYMFLFRDNLLIRELSPETGARRSRLPYED